MADCYQVNSNHTIAVMGLGYVGLPLVLAFGKLNKTIGFDIDEELVNELNQNYDRNGTFSKAQLKNNKHSKFTNDPATLKEASTFIIAVPTPITEAKAPDLRSILNATKTVSKVLKKGDMVVLESTVWPGLTREIIIPLLEEGSQLNLGVDFNVGYSPERINPGDSKHTLENVVKLVAGDCEETTNRLAELYGRIVQAGVFRASSIEVAEAAKVIENIQRDINIALMNELSSIFDKMHISTSEVLAAANTKWNFLDFAPGLVGGHCIGVDPYYLTYKAQKLGLHPEMILAGRRINDTVSKTVAKKVIELLAKSCPGERKSDILILGTTFKENIGDIRNSKVPDIFEELTKYGFEVKLHDPRASKAKFKEEYGIELSGDEVLEKQFSCVILAVPHREYLNDGANALRGVMRQAKVLIDLKSAIKNELMSQTSALLWSL